MTRRAPAGGAPARRAMGSPARLPGSRVAGAGLAGRGGRAVRLGLAALVCLAVAVVSAPLAAQEAEEPDTADAVLGQDGLYNRPFIGSVGGTSVGGYVEGNTNYFQEEGISDGFSMELRRFNLFVFSSIAPRLRLISELEFEHGTEEIALETALLDFEVAPALNLRGGILLPPVGYFNQNHDSPQWEFVERPLVSTEIIPATLSEVGFGVFGKFFTSAATFSYDLYLTNGLQDGIVLNGQGRTHIPSGKAEELLAEDNNGSPAITGRVAARRPGLGEIGVSAYRAEYNTFDVEGDRVAPARDVTIWAVDAGAEVARLQLRGELAWARIDVPPDLGELFGDEQLGFHLDAVFPVWEPRIGGLDDAVLNLALRVERVDFNIGTFSRTGRSIGDEETVVVPGLSFRPAPGTVFRLNYRRAWIDDLLGNPTADRAGVQVGFATYF